MRTRVVGIHTCTDVTPNDVDELIDDDCSVITPSNWHFWNPLPTLQQVEAEPLSAFQGRGSHSSAEGVDRVPKGRETQPTTRRAHVCHSCPLIHGIGRVALDGVKNVLSSKPWNSTYNMQHLTAIEYFPH